MTSIVVRHVNRVTAKGRVYYYHRPTGKRIKADPGDAAAFAAEVAALNAGARSIDNETRPDTVGGLIAAYKRSPQFLELAADTKKSYLRGFDGWQPVDGMPVSQLDQPFALALQEKIYRRRGRWLANMSVTVMSIVLAWGVPRGLVASNVAAGIPKIRRRKGTPTPNRAWTATEVDAALRASAGGLRKAIALAYYAGLRKKDVVELPRAARTANGVIDMTQSKTGRELSMFEARRLRTILDETDAIPGETVVVNTSGRPYTRDGLDSVFEKLKRDLLKAGAIRAGLTFHGLRKSLGKRAADAGMSENDIAAALGHSNPASARVYTAEAAQRSGAKRVIRALDRKSRT